jgi:hypothetical protein
MAPLSRVSFHKSATDSAKIAPEPGETPDKTDQAEAKPNPYKTRPWTLQRTVSSGVNVKYGRLLEEWIPTSGGRIFWLCFRKSENVEELGEMQALFAKADGETSFAAFTREYPSHIFFESS